MKEMKVAAIMEGTVIDHIPVQNTRKVADILNLSEIDTTVIQAFNLSSKKVGKKSIIKVEGLTLNDELLQKISLFAPDATISIIKDYKVADKSRVRMPDKFENIAKCFNPSCITNHEKAKTRFYVESKTPLELRCHFCERKMSEKEIRLL